MLWALNFHSHFPAYLSCQFMRDVGEWSLSFPLAHTSAVVKLCQYSSSAHGWPKSDYSLLTFYERKSICEHYQIQKLAFSLPSFALSLFLCHFDNVKTSSPTVARSIWTVMCMFAGRKVDGCQQSFIVTSGTSPGSHSSASMYIIFLWRQLCREVPAWSIAEFYTLLFSVSSFHL